MERLTCPPSRSETIATDLAVVNRSLDVFFARAEEARQGCEGPWFTLTQAQALAQLLRHAEKLVLQSAATQSEVRLERERYAAHLRRLAMVLRELQEDLEQFRFVLATQQQQIRAVRAWMLSQTRLGWAV